MNLLLGLLWSLAGMAIGAVVFGAGASVFARVTRASNREGAVGYFVIGLGLVGGLLGLVAGLVWYGRSAPAGEGLLQLGQGALGLVLFVALLALGCWAWVQTREVPVRYHGQTQPAAGVPRAGRFLAGRWGAALVVRGRQHRHHAPGGAGAGRWGA